MNVLQTLEPIVRDVIVPAAADTDEHARYPRAALQALGQAGLLGLLSAREVGGLVADSPKPCRWSSASPGIAPVPPWC